MVQWSSVNSIGSHVRKLDCSVYREQTFYKIIFMCSVCEDRAHFSFLGGLEPHQTHLIPLMV